MMIPFSFQSASNDCGPTCLKMMAAYYGCHYEINFLKKKCRIKNAGVSMLNIHRTAKAIGFHSRGVRLTIEKLKEIVQKHPVILYCNKSHFVIIYRSPKPTKKGSYYLADPAKGLIKMKESGFIQYWIFGQTNDTEKRSLILKKLPVSQPGYALLLNPANTIKKKAAPEKLAKRGVLLKQRR